MVVVLLAGGVLFGAYIRDDLRYEGFFFHASEEPRTNDESARIEIGEIIVIVNRTSAGRISIRTTDLSDGRISHSYTICTSSGLVCAGKDTFHYQQNEDSPHIEIGTLWAILPVSYIALEGFHSSIMLELVLF